MILIMLLLLIPGYVFYGKGEWTSVAIIAGIEVFLLILHLNNIADLKAWINRRNYWEEGGPDRRRR